MRGTIESIEERKTKKGKPYHLVKIDGEAYWVWESGLVKTFVKSDMVEFEFEGDEYPKLTSLNRVLSKGGEISSSAKKGGYNNNPKSMYLSYAKDIMVALINSTTFGKELTIPEIEQLVIRMGLAFYRASENGVVEEKPEPEEDIPMDFEKEPPIESNQSLFDSFNYQLINTKWANKEELAGWWAEGQKAMLKMTEDERSKLIKAYSEELGKTKEDKP